MEFDTHTKFVPMCQRKGPKRNVLFRLYVCLQLLNARFEVLTEVLIKISHVLGHHAVCFGIQVQTFRSSLLLHLQTVQVDTGSSVIRNFPAYTV